MAHLTLRAASAAFPLAFATATFAQLDGRVLLEAGDPLPGVPAGVTAGFVDLELANGEFALVEVQLDGPGISSSNNDAFFAIDTTNGVSLIERDTFDLPDPTDEFSVDVRMGLDGAVILRDFGFGPEDDLQLSQWTPALGDIPANLYPLTGVPYSEYDGIGFNRFLADGNTGVYYEATLEQTATFTNRGVFFADASGPTVIAASGDSLPGLGSETVDGVSIRKGPGDSMFVTVAPTVNGVQQVPGGPILAKPVIYQYTPAGGLTPFLASGDPAPLIPGARIDGIGVPARTPSGAVELPVELEIGVGGVTSSNDRLVYVYRDGVPSILLREGDPAPCIPGAQIEIGNPEEVDAGAFSIAMRLRQGIGGVTADNDAILVIVDDTGCTLVAREGDVAPGTNGSLYGDTLSVLPLRRSITDGDLVFQNTLEFGTGDVNSDNRGGAWHYDSFNGAITLVAREGTPITIIDDPAGAGVRTLRSSIIRAWYLEPDTLVVGDIYEDPAPGVPTNGIIAFEIPQACLADVNGDGDATPADFNAWVAAFNAAAPACDQNSDGLCDPSDFNAWIINYNAGC